MLVPRFAKAFYVIRFLAECNEKSSKGLVYRDDVILFDPAVFRFWTNASKEARIQAVGNIRLPAAAIDWDARIAN